MKIIHAEINTELSDKLIHFFENVFEWKLNQLAEYESYFKIDTECEKLSTSLIHNKKLDQKVILTVLVPSIKEISEKVILNEGKLIDEPIHVLNHGIFQYIKDPGGTIFCLKEEVL